MQKKENNGEPKENKRYKTNEDFTGESTVSPLLVAEDRYSDSGTCLLI